MTGSLILLLSMQPPLFLGVLSSHPAAQTTDHFARIVISKIWDYMPEVVEPKLREAMKKIAKVKLNDLDLGKEPKIIGIRVHNDPLNRQDMTIDFELRTHTFVIEVKKFLILRTRAKLELTSVKLRIVLRGIGVGNSALAQAVTVTLREDPTMSFSLDPGYGLEAMVRDKIRSAAADFVHPHKYTKPLDKGADLTPYLDPPPKGLLTISMEGTDGNTSIAIQYFVLRHNGRNYTTYVNSSAAFQRDTTLRIFAEEPDMERIEISFFAAEMSSNESYVGYLGFRLIRIVNGEGLSNDGWYDLEDTSSEVRARILFHYLPLSYSGLSEVYPSFRKEMPLPADICCRVWVTEGAPVNQTHEKQAKRAVHRARQASWNSTDRIFKSKSHDGSADIFDVFFQVRDGPVEFETDVGCGPFVVDLTAAFDNPSFIQRETSRTGEKQLHVFSYCHVIPETKPDAVWGDKDILTRETGNDKPPQI